MRRLWSRLINWLDNNINHRTKDGHAIWETFCDYNDSMLIDPRNFYYFEDEGEIE
jgi:hypothetical protein